ncbi:MAG: hypothetical protein ACOH5I_23745 [Oligoflexus sp.]
MKRFKLLPDSRHSLLMISTAFFGSTASLSETSIKARVDCFSRVSVNQSSSQACLSFSQLAVRLVEKLEEGLTAEIQFDPFGTPYAPFSDLPRYTSLIFPLNTDTSLNFIDHYALHWQFRNNLSLSIEEFSSATTLPNSSGLAFASRFQDSGWDQMAISALYHLPPLQGVDVRLVIGNGEGENGQNLDPQQFGALEINAFLMEGVFLKLGMSYDGNNLGSQQFHWTYGTSPASIGFSTDRQAIAIGLTGERPGLRGLKLSLGWQRTRVNDLDKSVQALPTTSPFSEDKNYDVNFLLVESPDEAVQIQRTVVNIGLSYRILAEYFVGFDYDQRTVFTDTVDAFEICQGIEEGNCLGATGRSNELKQTSYTLGFGKDLVPKSLIFTLEYNSTAYDKLYRNFNYRGDGEKKQKSFEAVNARLTYLW